jgi:choline dehydrogenase
VPTVDGDFDYIIVGGGTAGCVLADRLTADGQARVLLLEAGPRANSLWIAMPAGMGRLFVNPRYNWGFMGQPEPTLGGRELYFPQGKVLGGSSAINGMAFVRGQPEDYDGWRDEGAKGWGWGDVLPYFNEL